MTLPIMLCIALGLLLVVMSVKYLFLKQFTAELLQSQAAPPGKENVFSWDLDSVQDDVSKVYVGFTIGRPVSLFLEHSDGTAAEIRSRNDDNKE
jgi:hypothetical protein